MQFSAGDRCAQSFARGMAVIRSPGAGAPSPISSGAARHAGRTRAGACLVIGVGVGTPRSAYATLAYHELLAGLPVHDCAARATRVASGQRIGTAPARGQKPGLPRLRNAALAVGPPWPKPA